MYIFEGSILVKKGISAIDGGTPTGNGIVNANGIAFPATQVDSSDVNTLDDYQEGTWTPADGSGAGLSFTNVLGRYTKIGRMVFAQAEFTYPATASGSNCVISGLPFTSVNVILRAAVTIGYTATANLGRAIIAHNTKTIVFYTTAGAPTTNVQMSGSLVILNATYEAAD